MPRQRPPCMVPTCKKDPLDYPNYSFYVLPRKGDLRDSWLKAVQVDGSHISEKSTHYKVCQDHFESSDFERDLQSELLGIKRLKKKLKPNVVPWLFLPPPPAEKEVSESTVKDDLEEPPPEEDPDFEIDNRPKTRSFKKKPKPPKKKVPKYGCLICSKSPAQKIYWTKFDHPGANNLESLNKQLWTIFVLRTVLKLDASKCANLLAKFGKTSHPEDWLHVCSKCSSDLAQAMEYQQEIMRLQLKLNAIFERICKKAEDTVRLDKDANLKKTEIEEELWKTIREHNKIPLEADIKVEAEADTMEDDPMEIPSLADFRTSVIPERANDLAARIDQLLKQNESIVGESLTRPEGFESDSGSEDDRPKKKKTKTPKPIIKTASKNTAQTGTQKLQPQQLKVKGQGPIEIIPTPEVFLPRILAKAKMLRKFHKLKCRSCPAVFCTQEMFEKHKEDHTKSKEDGGKSECKFCGRVVFNEKLLKQHLEMKHKTGTIDLTEVSQDLENTECPFCPARFSKLPNLEAHLKLHERNAEFHSELDCPHPQCAHPFLSYKQLLQHLRNVHDESIANVCEICGFTISKALKWKWQSHVLMHRLEESKKSQSGEFVCPLCEKILTTKKSLIRHKRKFHADQFGLESYLCTQCPRQFITKSGLENHVETFHSTEHVAKRCCEICGEEFPNMRALINHQKNHRDKPKIFVCDRCGGEFNSLANLRGHKKDFYGEGLTDNSNEPSKDLQQVEESLRTRRRMTVFNSQKPQRCRHCGVKCPHLAALRRHVRTHSKIECNLCGNKFMTKDTLLKHVTAIHYSDKWTKTNCKYCGKEFKHRISVYGHYKYCNTKKNVEGAGSGGNADGVQCSKCKRSFKHKQALGGHLPYCKKYFRDLNDPELTVPQPRGDDIEKSVMEKDKGGEMEGVSDNGNGNGDEEALFERILEMTD